MKPLFILTLALIAATTIALVLSRFRRQSQPSSDAVAPPAQPEPFMVYGLAMLSVVAAVVTSILIPIVAIFHAAKEPALIALLVFFPLPILAYAFLARCKYLPRDTPTLKTPPRKTARK